MNDDAAIGGGSSEPQATDPVTVAVSRREGPAVPGKTGPKGPWRYTPERVHELAVSLERFFDATDSLYFETWACTERLNMRQVRRLVADSEEFCAVFDRCGCIQASRLLEGSTRLMDTTTNRTMYAVNPKVAALVLTAKHDFGSKGELLLRTPETDGYAQIESARKALQAAMPPALDQAREWLMEIRDNSPDESTRTAAEQLLARGDIEQAALAAGDAICNE